MRSEKFSLQDAQKVALLTRPTPAITSPARPESAKTDSSPWNAPFPMHRSRFAQKLNLGKGWPEDRNGEGVFPFAKIHSKANGPHEVRYVPPRLFARCGLAWDKARPWGKRLSWQTQGGRVK